MHSPELHFMPSAGSSSNMPDANLHIKTHMLWQGGGAMLATAVGFELQLHELPPEGLLEQGTAIWPLPAGLDAFQWYNEWKETAPFALETEFATAITPLGPVATVSFTNWDTNNSSDVQEAIQVTGSDALSQTTGSNILTLRMMRWHQ